ncbi:hypothetical protein [Cytobacillus sp. IB215665]|uniref:hypothetical protein n=1 Tax=Cytobacillus sp. IB215665 TaxID=3097357 RepID=UPI002A138D6A|nr:hypothetical protein [Cytobacillus sp. IB215665]MDX8367179.1 hypothetical protein [Cytobacillus sp. IB215665]
MSWGNHHELPFDSGLEEKILGPLSFSKLMFIAPSLIVVDQIANIYPKLPFDSIVFSRIHLAIPVVIAIVLAYFKDNRTNLTLPQLILTKLSLKRRRRVFYYQRINFRREDES